MIRKLLSSSKSCVLIISKCHSSSSVEAPLKGIKVLDLTRIIAGPMCTLMLADLGAEVYKVENPGRGDDTRHWPPMFKDNQSTSSFIALNRNKKSICVDFKTKDGQELLRSMAKKCDILVENYIPGLLKKYSLDFDSLREIAPHLIYCSLTGFGSTGPYAKKPGVDLIAASLSGNLYITGPEDGEPCRSGTSTIDIMTGLRANAAILASLYDRKKTGRGRKIDADLFTTAVASLKNYAVSYLNLNIEVNRLGTEHSYVVPYKCFKSKDSYITVGAINDPQFKILCEIVGRPELSKDERFITAANRAKNRKVLTAAFCDIFITKSTKEWCDLLANTPLPHAPLNGFKETSPPTLRLKCRKPKSDKSVKWNEDTVDNEHMNKKKSKCCCIYKKPKQRFDESSESESDECENCFGHVEVKQAKKVAKASCSEQSASTSSSDVTVEHPQPINPSGSGMTTVSS